MCHAKFHINGRGPFKVSGKAQEQSCIHSRVNIFVPIAQHGTHSFTWLKQIRIGNFHSRESYVLDLYNAVPCQGTLTSTTFCSSTSTKPSDTEKLERDTSYDKQIKTNGKKKMQSREASKEHIEMYTTDWPFPFSVEKSKITTHISAK